jgi:hypothetical protein
MPFEDFDNKIRQAAEQHHPNYDEKAWSKMNGLLDQHLPQKEDRRRRIIFFLLAFLLLGGGATWLLIDKPWEQDTLTNNSQVNNNQTATSTDASPQSGDINTSEKDKVNTAPSTAAPDRTATDASTGPTTGANTDAANNTTQPGTTVARDNATLASPITNNSKQVKNQPFKGKRTKDGENQFQVDVSQGNIGGGKQQPATKSQTDKEKQAVLPGEKKTEPAIVTTGSDAKPLVNDNKNTASGLPPANDLIAKTKVTSSPKDSANDQPKADEEKKTAKKERAKKPNQFFFYLSAGPDVSSVGMGNPGKTRLLTGGGLGYTFRDRLTIRTGFYSASKVYTARPADYKPSDPVQNANYLEDISANCKVYEIPLSLSYNFGKSAKHKTFASVGLSSFIMKKETYDYLYEYPGSPPMTYHYIHTVNNENKHYFSVLSLSAGYQRKINRMLSVTAEPYFKLPLAGVGYGKVKLNSFGVMFSLNVSPFATKK